MENKIRIGIVGYGNLGRGVLKSVAQNSDMSVEAIFTRRNNVEVEGFGPATNISEIEKFKDKIDVMILCGGSATDLPKQGPEISKYFNTVDSFDTHAKIPEYFEAVDKSAKESGKLSIISVGWDPGLFSLNRVYAESILPEGETYTFWGKGVSQGHSDAIRRVEGVKNGVQYTVPKEEALEKVRSGADPELTTREKHLRVCYVVLDEGADEEKVANEIKTMPNYFDEYDTVVNFISEEEFNKEHRAMPHGGFVIRSGKTGAANNEKIEFSLQLDSNPEFTSSVLTAYARAIYRMAKEGRKGAITVFDVAPSYLSRKSASELRKELL